MQLLVNTVYHCLKNIPNLVDHNSVDKNAEHYTIWWNHSIPEVGKIVHKSIGIMVSSSSCISCPDDLCEHVLTNELKNTLLNAVSSISKCGLSQRITHQNAFTIKILCYRYQQFHRHSHRRRNVTGNISPNFFQSIQMSYD